MAISSISAIDTEQQLLERISLERVQREQARLAQLQADDEAERLRQALALDRQRLDRAQALADSERQRQQSSVSAQQDAVRRQDDRLAQARVQGTVVPAQQFLEERARVDAPSAYRAQSTPPPAASSMTDLRA